MPYFADPSPAQVQSAALFLYALSRRPLETDDDDRYVRLDRRLIWDAVSASPLAAFFGRREDFYESIRQVEDQAPCAVEVKTAAARRVDVILSRIEDDWQDLYPTDVLNARIAELGLDRTSTIADADRIIGRRRKTPDAEITEKRCARCKEVKPITAFNRRGNGWQTYDRECQAIRHREWAAANPHYELGRDRSARYSGRRSRGLTFGP